MRPSSALGWAINRRMVVKRVGMLIEGVHDPCCLFVHVGQSMTRQHHYQHDDHHHDLCCCPRHTCGCGLSVSKQILPWSSILGWKIGVMNRTFGGSNGYLFGRVRTAEKEEIRERDALMSVWPSWHFAFCGPVLTTYLSETSISRRKTPSAYGVPSGPWISVIIIIIIIITTTTTRHSKRAFM